MSLKQLQVQFNQYYTLPFITAYLLTSHIAQAGFTGFSKRRRAHAPIMLKSAEDIHYSVLHLYDVPQVSLMDSLLPGSSESMRQWIKSKLFVDDKYECKSKQENQATSVQHAC
eukprot:m.786006 g.786006  ORF g.786006 m.786006 type:complete len:113 (+) comp23304_c0_seq31:1251-1589(+)